MITTQEIQGLKNIGKELRIKCSWRERKKIRNLELYKALEILGDYGFKNVSCIDVNGRVAIFENYPEEKGERRLMVKRRNAIDAACEFINKSTLS